ncbi:hypothetical protein diail_9412 [Diaporthe ilicicola]|nr:hypothetical protein diail_9412 [Diaporthe ilicicola]
MSKLLYSLSALVAVTQAAHDPFFCSVVFNNVARKTAGWPNVTWDSLTSHGVKKWVGFLDPELSGHPQGVPADIMAANEPLVVYNPENVDRGLEILKGSPPVFMELLNEPDIPLGDRPKISPADAAKAVEPILKYNENNNVTTLLTPALSHPNDIFDTYGWLAQFDGNCSGCISSRKIPIIATHQYNLKAEGVVDSLKRIHDRWPDHELWVTELAPSTHVLNNCPKTLEQVGNWMEIVRDKVSDHDCIHSLTYDNGTATPLLTRYSKLCGDLS